MERTPVAAAAAELHSELTLVCPDLRSRLRELLAECGSDAAGKPVVTAKPAIVSVARPAVLPPAGVLSDSRGRLDPGQPVAVVAYACLRLVQTAFVLGAICAAVMLLWLAEVIVL